MSRNFNDPFYREVMSKIKKRDGKKCQMPGCKKRRRLQVHHIRRWADSPSLGFDPYNLITLCRGCHDSIKDKESHYIPVLSEIAATNENNQRHKRT